jgi:hypothetical protein
MKSLEQKTTRQLLLDGRVPPQRILRPPGLSATRGDAANPDAAVAAGQRGENRRRMRGRRDGGLAGFLSPR